ncbi:MAG: methyltransferase domain-containing protein [Desulfobacteraceae bacterium]|nr:methyltransferase domain-containing protein [Desulfobacteraceae bacterium]
MCLPDVDVNCEKLYQMLYANLKTKLLTTSIRLGIYDHLFAYRSVAEVAEAVDSDPVNTEFLLNGLTSCGLLKKSKGLYANEPVAQNFLVKGVPTYLGESFLMQSGMRDMMVSDLYKLVKEGPDKEAADKFERSEEQWGRFAKSMANNARAGVAQQMSELVSGLPEFPLFGKMLDLGSGPGIFGIAMVAKHPSMKGVLFDREPSTRVAQQFIEEYQLEDRMDVLAGDYNRDSIGEGYDFIWASSTLNFAQADLKPVMAKIYDALNPGGVFINLSEGLTHESTQPEFFVLCTMAWSMHNRPLKAFDQGVIASEMIEAGFKSVRTRTLDTNWGPMDMDIARK